MGRCLSKRKICSNTFFFFSSSAAEIAGRGSEALCCHLVSGLKVAAGKRQGPLEEGICRPSESVVAGGVWQAPGLAQCCMETGVRGCAEFWVMADFRRPTVHTQWQKTQACLPPHTHPRSSPGQSQCGPHSPTSPQTFPFFFF